MNLDAVKQKIAALSQDSGSKEKIDYTKTYWKPKKEGDSIIRFLPSVLNKDFPFYEFYVIYGVDRFPLSSLKNWGEDCPIEAFSKKLINSGDTEKWKLGRKLEPKLRVFAPVIVRGEEDLGVRQIELSKTLYLEMLGYLDDPEYGDFSDINEGYDFTVTAKPADNGKGFTMSFKPRRNNSPLSKDAKKVELWLEEQPNVLELKAVYKPTYESCVDKLKEFLNPTEEVKEDEVVTEVKAVEDPVSPTPKFEIKTSKDDEFDKLFNDKNSTSITEEEDDLPF